MNVSLTIPKPLDITAIRQEFPILNREVKGKPLIYLDNAATLKNPSRLLMHSYIIIQITMPIFTAAFIPWPKKQQRLLKQPAML